MPSQPVNQSTRQPLRIDEAQCRRLGALALRLPSRREHFMPPMPPGVGDDGEALFWLVATAICQQTRTLVGTVEGRSLRGADYLIAALRQHLARHPERWAAQALATWTAAELRAAVSDVGDPATSTLDRIDERLEQLRGVGAHVAERWGGRAMAIHATSDGHVATLLGRLAAMPAFADPVQKKSHLLLIFLHERGLWPVADPENLEVAIDYHVMRVALRVGLLEVEDDALRQQLVEQRPADEALDTTVRLAVRGACRAVLGATPGLTPFRLDNLLWMVGRNCCFYEHEPVCTKPGACWKIDICSLIVSFPHNCGLSCPLSPVCRGASDPAHRALHEVAHTSPHY